ncbi:MULTISPECIES: TIGR03943 family putative permease subunit [Paenibacillus]|uniref:TIGR03943 family protein n=1 Tax=Paenibacillus violae TaxID=3077234 RepID=A0ABU3RMG2_9BACL|nr:MULTISPECIES: TIGR03943 family protein [Paenibacillus]MDU0205433.1 TIGR03943 family protein [Paenibacillus sp. PFR10]MEC0268577.1 TIGR03943 family protein [Paenibacillus anseongense]
MSQARIISFHYFLRTAILLGFSSYIVILFKSGALTYYIAPRMMIYVKIASVILYIIACFQGYMALRAYWGKPVTCECEQPVSRSVLRNTLAYGLLILPLFIGFALPDTALSSTMVAAKGMNLSASKSSLTATTAAPTTGTTTTGTTTSKATTETATTATDPAPAAAPSISSTEMPAPANTDADLRKLFQADKEWDEDFSKIGMILYKKDTIVVKPEIYMEILSSIDLFKNNFIGKKIELTGFVYREDNMASNQFVVGRFAVSCCSADATPYGVMIDFPTAETYPKDMWVKVTGTVQNGSYNGNDIFIIKATQIDKIEAPSSPYVYPNFEPLKELQ